MHQLSFALNSFLCVPNCYPDSHDPANNLCGINVPGTYKYLGRTHTHSSNLRSQYKVVIYFYPKHHSNPKQYN